jgi:hypothetical protein
MDMRVEAARVVSTRLVKMGMFERDYTLYKLLAKVSKTSAEPATVVDGAVVGGSARSVEKRFSEFETFHEVLEPAMTAAVAVHKEKAAALMLEAQRASAAVAKMESHVRLLGCDPLPPCTLRSLYISQGVMDSEILRRASGGWLSSKNNPEMVANRAKMLTSYLRGALRFADHPRVQGVLATFAMTADAADELWEPDPDDPNQLIGATPSILAVYPWVTVATQG